MSGRKDLRQSDWQIELSPRKNVEPRIVGIRSTFRGSTFFRLVEIRLNGNQALGQRRRCLSYKDFRFQARAVCMINIVVIGLILDKVGKFGKH